MAYESKPLKAPLLRGRALRAVAWLAESRTLGGPLRSKLLKDIGIAGFRDLQVDEPAFLPPPLPKKSTLDDPACTGAPPDLAALCAERPAPSGEGFAFRSTADYARAFRDGGADPVAVAQRAIEAIAASEATDPKLRAFIAHDPADVRRQAEASAARFKAGKALGPLDGVPITIKDEVDQAGYPTTVGTSFLGREKATADATSVARLRATGAVLLGKANMHEIGLGVNGLNLNHGTPRNPYHLQHATGGSSSGCAAAVAAGLSPLSLAADGGGSIRLPSSFCGLVGLKPTYGRVSEHGAAPLCWSMAHIGPIAATALDAAIGYAIMGGADPKDAMTLGQPALHLDGFGNHDLADLTIGVYRPWFEDADPEVVETCHAMLEKLESAGAKLREIEIPGIEHLSLVHAILIVSEMASGQWRYYDRFHTQYGADVRINLALARAFKATDYVQAQRLRQRLWDDVARVHEEVDVIATPMTGCVAPEYAPEALVGGESNLPLLDKISRFARLANLTGSPAISFPAGYAPSGMPVGMQLIGRPWHEHTLLRVAGAAEALLPRQKPERFYSLLQETASKPAAPVAAGKA